MNEIKVELKPDTRVDDRILRSLGALIAARSVYLVYKDPRPINDTVRLIGEDINDLAMVLGLSINFLCQYASQTAAGIDGLLDYLLKESGV